MGMVRASQKAGLLMVVILLLALLPGGAAGAPAQVPAVNPAIWETIEAEGEAEVLVVLREQANLGAVAASQSRAARGRLVYDILQATAGAGQRDLRALLDARGAEYRPYYIVNAVWVRADADLLRALAARGDVARILSNPRVRGVEAMELVVPARAPEAVEDNLVRVHADAAWALGHTGQGVVVAGQDTGYDWDHPALVNQYRGWDGTTAGHDYNWHDAIHSGGGTKCGADSPEPCDDHPLSHGTHTMGIMVGDDGGQYQVGVAPDAEWIGCRNMDQGVGTPATYLECFEFFLAPYPLGGQPDQGEPALAPDIVNNSWGCPPSEGCDADHVTVLEQSVLALRQAGIAVVASAGNTGSSCESVASPPGLLQATFSVGNFDHRTNLLAANSSRGPVTYGGQTYVKPDIAAPGTLILSSVDGGGYGRLSGTSMASPHVAGAMALLLSAGPGFAGNVDALEALLTSTAEYKPNAECGSSGPPNNAWGWGILDVLKAVSQVQTGTLRGVVVDGESGTILAGAWVEARPDPLPAAVWRTTTGPDGTYSLTLPVTTYGLTAGASHFGPQVVAGVTVLPKQLTTQDLALLPLLRFYLMLVSKNG